MIASTNQGKLDEFRDLLAPSGFELEGIETDVPEDADTYSGNATLKAEAACIAAALPALGDDSGLEVEALDGLPGLRSARLGTTQEERHRLLLARLRNVPRPWRARFVCAVALARPGRATQVFMGQCEGEVVEAPTGGGGFGYDPIFLVPESGRTFAQMTREEKHRWSHRGAAVRALLASGALTGISATG